MTYVRLSAWLRRFVPAVTADDNRCMRRAYAVGGLRFPGAAQFPMADVRISCKSWRYGAADFWRADVVQTVSQIPIKKTIAFYL